MLNIQIRTRTDPDGVLRIDVPTALAETEVEGCLVINPIPAGTLRTNAAGEAWPDGYFEATAGKWKGDLERGEQGSFDRRDWLE